MRKLSNIIFIVLVFTVVLSITGTLSCKKETERIMKVLNDSIGGIFFKSANAYASIIDIGQGVEQHGHCWSSSSSPTLENYENRTQLGKADKPRQFSSHLASLSPNIDYHVRAYVKNGGVIVYSKDMVFRTMASASPGVITGAVIEFSMTSAVVEGEIVDIGEGAEIISEHGHCWSSETSTPTFENDKTMLGERSSTGMFTSEFGGLTRGTLYYVRAYAINISGTVYGETVTFTTTNFPSVATAYVTEITSNSAIIGGNILDEGGKPILAKGICWSTNPDPDLTDNPSDEGSGPNSFESIIEGLLPGTQYHARAYATNINGTGYGENFPFTTEPFVCGTRFTDERDRKSYLTVQIGDQCWMAQNLNHGMSINSSASQTDNQIIEKYCYENDKGNCDLYGGIYQWDELMQYTTMESTKGVCPDGWHVPSDYEWKVLEMSLGMSQESADSAGWRGTDEGGKLKATGTSFWDSPNLGATNTSIFTALPGGMGWEDGSFSGMGEFAVFWTSTLFVVDTHVLYRLLNYNSSKIYRVDGSRPNSTPVRCIKD